MWVGPGSCFVTSSPIRGLFWQHSSLVQAVPVFILAEANLGLLGLGVTEPMPSWGTLIKEMEGHFASGQPLFSECLIFTPAVLILLVVLSLTVIFPSEVTT